MALVETVPAWRRRRGGHDSSWLLRAWERTKPAIHEQPNVPPELNQRQLSDSAR